jgi:hypothetical protein
MRAKPTFRTERKNPIWELQGRMMRMCKKTLRRHKQGRGKLHSDDLHNLYYSQNITLKMTRAGNVPRVREMRTVYKILVRVADVKVIRIY